MNEFITSLKQDLLDRRLLPLVAIVVVALLGGLVYALAAAGGSSSPAPVPAPVASNGAVPPGLAVTSSTPDKSVAETTDGVKEQQNGHARNPFAVLAGTGSTASSSSPSASSASSSSSSSSSSNSSSSSGSSGSESSGSSGSSGSKEETKSSSPSKKQSKKSVYHVAILFGLYPPGSTPENVKLTPYENLKLQTPLPSAKQPLIVFRGVTAFGKSATFTIVGETILHGQGACLPSSSQCQALDLKAGQTEQLEYLQPNGETTVYELRVVSIEKAAASASASAKSASAWDFSRAGAALLRKSGLFDLPYLRYSSQPGLLVFAPPQGKRAKGAKAHAAVVNFHFPRFW